LTTPKPTLAGNSLHHTYDLLAIIDVMNDVFCEAMKAPTAAGAFEKQQQLG
jgi:hypothetical protein